MILPLTQRYLMYISYIGTGFRGSQIQLNTPGYLSNTIQGTVSAALTEFIKLSPDNLVSTKLTSRTDAGVHAFKNGLHFDLPMFKGKFLSGESIKTYLNKKFSNKNINIRITEVLKVPDHFHVHKSAYEKTYIYRIGVPKENLARYDSPIFETNRTYFLRNNNINLEKIQALEELFVGEKDFGCFGGPKTERSTICKITSFKINKTLPFMVDWHQSNVNFDYYHLTFIGNRFLYKMVRRLVGVSLAVALLKLNIDDVQKMFDKPDLSSWNNKAVVVPGYGLYLADIKYNSDHLTDTKEESS